MSRLDAVWAAVYVRVLSAMPPSSPDADHHIQGIAEMLADPTVERMRIAVSGCAGPTSRPRRGLRRELRQWNPR